MSSQVAHMVTHTNLLALDDRAANSINTLFMTIFIGSTL